MLLEFRTNNSLGKSFATIVFILNDVSNPFGIVHNLQWNYRYSTDMSNGTSGAFSVVFTCFLVVNFVYFCLVALQEMYCCWNFGQTILFVSLLQ